jgi:hypothetical protein
MARDDGVKYGAGGAVMLSEVPEVPVVEAEKVVTTLAARQNKKKVEVLEERLEGLPEGDE